MPCPMDPETNARKKNSGLNEVNATLALQQRLIAKVQAAVSKWQNKP